MSIGGEWVVPKVQARVIFPEDYESDTEDDEYNPNVPAWKEKPVNKDAELDEESFQWLVSKNIDPTLAKAHSLPPIKRTAKDILDVLKQKITHTQQRAALRRSRSVMGERLSRSESSGRLPELRDAAGTRGGPRAALIRQRSEPTERKARASYQSKYSPDVVLLVRDFYKEVMADGNYENQQRAFTSALQKKQYKGLESIEFQNLLDAAGKLTFKNLIRSIYPYANTRDVASMILFAFPPNRRDMPEREITQKERQELIELFKLWDTDNNLMITLEEFMRGMKDLSLSKADLLVIMQQLDKDGDGVLSLEEFIEGMHRTYF